MQALKIMQKSIGIEPTGKLKLNSKKYWNNPKKKSQSEGREKQKVEEMKKTINKIVDKNKFYSKYYNKC